MTSDVLRSHPCADCADEGRWGKAKGVNFSKTLRV